VGGKCSPGSCGSSLMRDPCPCSEEEQRRPHTASSGYLHIPQTDTMSGRCVVKAAYVFFGSRGLPPAKMSVNKQSAVSKYTEHNDKEKG